MDFLKDCMNDVGNPPIDVMNKNWCVGCGNRGCERAGQNQSAFDKRVKNWRETLFLNVPRAAPDDPSYDNIRSRSFAPAGPPAPPRTTVFIPGPPAMSSPVPMAKPGGFVRQEPAVEAEETPFELEPVAAPAIIGDPGTTGRTAPPGNTPFEQGTVLGGGPAPQAVEPASTREPGPGVGTTFILEDD